jgi:hypothetical protein
MWRFKKIEPGEPERNPRESEFFRLTEPDEAVIREFVQNSLDARRQEIAVVRVYLGSAEWHEAYPFFETLEPHLKACGFNFPSREMVDFLTLEDYGTTGLDGEITRSDSNFYNFWWREGISAKAGASGGRWGLGKTTFHLASKIKTFWGLTIRENDTQPLLMGKSLLKPHQLSSEIFGYAGYYCEDGFKPIEDVNTIMKFKEMFHIRRINEPGLSIVMPFPLDNISCDGMKRSLLAHYFYAILTGKMKVEIGGSDSNELIINKDNLIEHVNSLSWKGTNWQNVDLESLMKFVVSAIENRDQCVSINIANPADPEINEDSFPEIEILRQRFRTGMSCHFKVPLEVQLDNSSAGLKTFVNLHLQKLPLFDSCQEFFVRSGILISDIKTLGRRPVFSLLEAEDEPVARFLGDSETPAHTNWNERTEGFKEKYENGVRLLRFIKKSALKIVTILDEPPVERQAQYLQDIFSIALNKGVNKPGPNGGEEAGGGRKIPPGKEALFDIWLIHRGFTVSLNSKKENISFPVMAIIKMAYDSRRGNPFSQYEKFDFDVSKDPIKIECRDCDLRNYRENIIEIGIKERGFMLSVVGFDPDRDLVIDIKEVVE